ncbi:lipopolysaccharide export system protein LptA [Verrucomicrobium sp. GAS474]|uniref:LptA/OstA family protein n=1 Tax=Verrucomicrobium sp. GAS474 TaxID=1882831 RepID=UPI00087B8738|nr:LptA/OstA family protein [Verrucomicrobium sp. GAS474]SDU08968.1 lipopolysaccharide export system protein LptA [Verrucomicrobium sp. GAS474]
MKAIPALFIALFLGLTLPAVSQTAPEETTVNADSCRFDMGQKQAVFTTNVSVTSKGFSLKTKELTVFFSKSPGGKVERMLARGDVDIVSDGRAAKAAQAEYIAEDDRLILTGSPQVTQGKDVITGTTITLYRGSNRMEVEGRSRLVIGQDFGKSAAQPTP